MNLNIEENTEVKISYDEVKKLLNRNSAAFPFEIYLI